MAKVVGTSNYSQNRFISPLGLSGWSFYSDKCNNSIS